MSTPADIPAQQHRDLLGEVEDFGQSALHTAIESPVNGVIQLVDHTANVHLPELNIIGAPTHDSFGAKAGAVVGAAADIIGLSIATGGVADLLGGAGLVGGVATAAATGAIYGGILTPTDTNSKHFFQDRLANGAIAAATFATMNGAAQALNASGIFAAPAARSLVGSLNFGALAGAAGGVAQAESRALLKEHKLLPSAEELAGSVGYNSLFGAAYGGLGYAYNNIAGPASRPTTVEDGNHSITTVNDSNGQPVKFSFKVPTVDTSDYESVLIKGLKMTDGTWKTSGNVIYNEDGQWNGDAEIPHVTNVSRASDGSVTVNSDDGEIRTFGNGTYSKTNPTEDARQAAALYSSKNFDRTDANGNREIASETEGYRRLDPRGNTLEFSDKLYSSNGARMTYGSDGKMDSVVLNSGDQSQPYVHLTRTGADTWSYSKGDNSYTWKGQITPVANPGNGNVNGLSFKAANGQTANFDLTSGTQNVATAIDNSSIDNGMRPELGYARAAGNGAVALKGSQYQKLEVDGKPVTGEIIVKPGNHVTVNVDVGDRYAVWETRDLSVFTAEDGATMINGQELSGNKPINLSTLVNMHQEHPETYTTPRDTGKDYF